MTDKKLLHIISSLTLTVLLIVFFIPFDTAGRIIASLAIAAAAAVSYVFIKKRSILSMNKDQVLMIISAIAVAYLMLYYLTGLKFGFERNAYALKMGTFLSHCLPAAAIIVASEIFRYIIRSQDDRATDLMCYLSCVLAEMIAHSTATVALSTFNNFMDLIAQAMFPAITANLVYHYLSKRYGFYPNIVYRAVTTLYLYLIPYTPAMASSLYAFVKLLVPLAIFIFIDSLYEKKIRYALGKKSKLEIPITILAVTIMLSIVMLVSNQFGHGMLVIATESMTGELNKGDAALFEKYDDQTIEEGRVIVFKDGKSMIVHRVDDIQIINGITRYYTKGDANEKRDAGFITDSNIIGIVNFKIPYVGYPTLWLRSLFSR